MGFFNVSWWLFSIYAYMAMLVRGVLEWKAHEN